MLAAWGHLAQLTTSPPLILITDLCETILICAETLPIPSSVPASDYIGASPELLMRHYVFWKCVPFHICRFCHFLIWSPPRGQRDLAVEISDWIKLRLRRENSSNFVLGRIIPHYTAITASFHGLFHHVSQDSSCSQPLKVSEGEQVQPAGIKSLGRVKDLTLLSVWELSWGNFAIQLRQCWFCKHREENLGMLRHQMMFWTVFSAAVLSVWRANKEQ